MSEPEFKVVDVLRAPHGGWILRLRLDAGEAPSIRRLRKAELTAVSPEGEERRVRVTGFPLFSGRPSDERFARTGRIELRVTDGDAPDSDPISTAWRVLGPAA